ncbi:demethylmenaquinone methyltransferase [Actinomycetes bacterium]|nr:demethylmenaquinone methyltransferase [Actinomycetes bacterium]
MSQPDPVLGVNGELPRGENKRQVVEEMFDRVAPGYDRMNRIISLGLDTRWRNRTLEALRLAPAARVLDLACGTGDFCVDLTASGYRAVGADFSAGMLNATRTSAPLVRVDAAALAYPAESFDAVVCGFALRNFVDLVQVFAEVARVLRPGGRFAALDAAVPESYLARAGNTVWFRGVVPVLGRVLSRDPEAYRYLPASTAYLPEPETLINLLVDSGFTNVEHTTMTAGSVQLLTGTRS